MRKLKIAAKKVTIYLEHVPEEYKFVETIAQQYSNNKSELEEYYLAGIDALNKLTADHSPEFFQKHVLWTVRQTIIKKLQEKKGFDFDE